MAEIKLTKNELRLQQLRLAQLQKYLPTLQLKKALLQLQVNEARAEIVLLQENLEKKQAVVNAFSGLFFEHLPFAIADVAKVIEVKKTYENIAGVEVPQLQDITFAGVSYGLLETPPWIEQAIEDIHNMVYAKISVLIAEEKKHALEMELRGVSIRVNLFEKILIPRSINNIKRIKAFLGDQQLGAVSQAKVAKGKIVAKKQKPQEEEMLHAG